MAQQILALQPGTDIRESRRTHQYFDGKPFRAAVLLMSGGRGKDAEIPFGKGFRILVDQVDTAAGQGIDQFKIGMGMLRDFHPGLF